MPNDELKTVKDWLMVDSEEKRVSVTLPEGWTCDVKGVDSGLGMRVEKRVLEGREHPGMLTVWSMRYTPAPTVEGEKP